MRKLHPFTQSIITAITTPEVTTMHKVFVHDGSEWSLYGIRDTLRLAVSLRDELTEANPSKQYIVADELPRTNNRIA